MNKATVVKIKAVTLALATGAYLPLADIADPAIAKAAKLIRKGGAFSDHSEPVSKNATKQVLATVLGVDVAQLGKRELLSYKPFTALVATNGEKGDAAADVDGRVLVLMDSQQSSYFTCSDGTQIGTKMSTSRSWVRPATPAEIDGFAEEWALFHC